MALSATTRTSVTRGTTRVRRAAETGLLEPVNAARRGGNPVLMIIGYSLLLVLAYLLIARPKIVSAIGGLSSIGSSAAKAWVAPVDPLQALGAAPPSPPGGASPSSAGGAGAGSSSSGGGEAGGSSVGGTGPSSWTPHNAPAPSSIKVSKVKGASNAQIERLDMGPYRAHNVHLTMGAIRALKEGRLSIAQAEAALRGLPSTRVRSRAAAHPRLAPSLLHGL